MHFDVVGRLDFGVEGASTGKGEPKFDLIGEGGGSFFMWCVNLDIEGAFFSFGVDLECEEFAVDEVVSDDGVGLAGEVGPGVDFDALRLGHKYLN